MTVKTIVKSTFLILAVLLLVVCSVVIPTLPVKAVPEPVHIIILPVPVSILANGISTSLITITVEDENADPIPGVTANLSTDHGVLSIATPVTNLNGQAFSTLTSEASSTMIIATIKVIVDGLRDATAVYFLPAGYPPVFISGTGWVSGTGTITGGWWGTVDIVATGDHCLTEGFYAGNPAGGEWPPNYPFLFFDLYLDNTTGVSNITVSSCLFNWVIDGFAQQAEEFAQQAESFRQQRGDFPAWYFGDPDDIWDRLHFSLYYLDGTNWVYVGEQYLVNGCLTFTLNNSTMPNISQLGGLVFADTFTIEPLESIPDNPIPEKPFNEGDVSPTMTSGAHTFVRNVSVLQSQVAAGEPATVYANVVNTGDVAGGFTATLKVNGQVEKTENYVINGQAAQPVKYVIYRDQPGTYEVDLNGQKASFTVVGSAANNNPATNTQIILMVVIGAAILTAVLLVVLLRRRSTS